MRIKKNAQWMKLDNAAKIFPPTSGKRDPRVFRFSCELFETVEEAHLQEAMARTIRKFPHYRSVLKRGLFWYYFEQSALDPVVAAECTLPCSPLYSANKKGLLFQVTYYKKRINLEIYHALADGTGAVHFLKTLVFYYLKETHPHDAPWDDLELDYDASEGQRTADSFAQYYRKGKHGRQAHPPRAYRLRGERIPEYRISVIEGIVSVGALLKKAHQSGVTLTELMTAVLIRSIGVGMSVRERARPVVIAVPVNLRKFFPSSSSRNFFCNINISHRFETGKETLDAVIDSVKNGFAHELDAENLETIMNGYAMLEHTLAMKVIPLVIKDPVMKAAGGLAESKVTAGFSNVGKIELPEGIARFVRLFDVFSSTNRLQVCACSYSDQMVISFTAPFRNTDVQREFFRTLTGMGLNVEICANVPEEE